MAFGRQAGPPQAGPPQPRQTTQPIAELAATLKSLGQAIKMEPEEADRQALEAAFKSILAVHRKNLQEQSGGGSPQSNSLAEVLGSTNS